MYYRNMKHKHDSEQGIVSILTVLFLTMVLAVMTVAFLRIMNDEQIQTLNDDLSKSAYAAALSGVEDAKRALKYCNGLSGVDKATCLSQLTQTGCPGAMRTPSMLTSVSNPIINPTGQVGGSPSLNQRYTCMMVNMATDDFVERASSSQPVLVDLMPDTGSFRTVVVRWHRLSESEARYFDGPAYFSDADTTDNPRDVAGEWTDGDDNPAVGMLRAQLMAYESDNSSNSTVSRDDIDRKTAATYFVPRNDSYPEPSTVGRINAPRGGGTKWRFQDQVRQNIRCTDDPDTYAGYSCQARIQLHDPGTGARDLAVSKNDNQSSRYFLLLSSLYDNPHFQVSLEDGDGDAVQLYAVQPEIDVTGAAADVYRRVKARVSYAGSYTPKDALQSGASLCKAFYVTGDPWTLAEPAQRDPMSACSGLTLGPGDKYPIPETPTPPPPPPPPLPYHCNEPQSRNAADYAVNANIYGLVSRMTVDLEMPLTPGCQYQFWHLWGDTHPNQQRRCEAGDVQMCNVWKQPIESYFVEFVTNSGAVVGKTPLTGDIPDRFAPGTPGLAINPLGISGAEAVWLMHRFTTPAGDPVTKINIIHEVQDPSELEHLPGNSRPNSAHVYGFRFDQDLP